MGSVKRLLFHVWDQSLVLIKLLTRQALVLKPGEWHTIRAEVRGSQQRYLVDNRLVAEASDDSLKKGFFYISVGKGAVIQFSNVRVFSLAEPTQ